MHNSPEFMTELNRIEGAKNRGELNGTQVFASQMQAIIEEFLVDALNTREGWAYLQRTMPRAAARIEEAFSGGAKSSL